MPSSGEVGTLWIVPTPIGNLGDITERAREVLSAVDGVLCEDTRRATQLYRGLGIALRPTERMDAHVSARQLETVVERLLAGESLALISDAGTPGVSDPGARLVFLARHSGVRVVALPGPSAVTQMVSILGAQNESEEQQPGFEFVGFLPRQGLSKRWLEWVAQVRPRSVHRVIAFESPHRIVGSLQDLADLSIPSTLGGVSIRCVVAKELTKLHERVWEGTLQEVAEQVASEVKREGALGEWCVAWVFATMDVEQSQGRVIPQEETPHALTWKRWLEILIALDVSVSRATASVCQEFGAPKNAVYAQALAFAELRPKKNKDGG